MRKTSEQEDRRRRAAFRMLGAMVALFVVEGLLMLVLPLRVWIYQSFIALVVYIVVLAFIVIRTYSGDKKGD